MLGSKPVSGRQITCYFCLIARYAPSAKYGAKGEGRVIGRQGFFFSFRVRRKSWLKRVKSRCSVMPTPWVVSDEGVK